MLFARASASKAKYEIQSSVATFTEVAIYYKHNMF
jgi:hypothetical protein